MSYLLQQEISRHPVGLEQGDAAVTKCMQASRCKPRNLRVRNGEVIVGGRIRVARRRFDSVHAANIGLCEVSVNTIV